MLSLRQVALLFGVTRQTVLNWVNSGYLVATKIGRQYRVEQSEVDRLRNGGGE